MIIIPETSAGVDEVDNVDEEKVDEEKVDKEKVDKDTVEKDKVDKDNVEKVKVDKDNVERDKVDKDNVEKDKAMLNLLHAGDYNLPAQPGQPRPPGSIATFRDYQAGDYFFPGSIP